MIGILLGGLFTFAFGGMILILALGARRIEAELAGKEREEQKGREEVARIPRFFFVPQSASPRTGRMDEALLWQLREYLDAEQVFADEFVSQPSVESLYRDTGSRFTTH